MGNTLWVWFISYDQEALFFVFYVPLQPEDVTRWRVILTFLGQTQVETGLERCLLSTSVWLYSTRWMTHAAHFCINTARKQQATHPVLYSITTKVRGVSQPPSTIVDLAVLKTYSGIKLLVFHIHFISVLVSVLMTSNWLCQIWFSFITFCSFVVTISLCSIQFDVHNIFINWCYDLVLLV